MKVKKNLKNTKLRNYNYQKICKLIFDNKEKECKSGWKYERHGILDNRYDVIDGSLTESGDRSPLRESRKSSLAPRYLIR